MQTTDEEWDTATFQLMFDVGRLSSGQWQVDRLTLQST